MEGKSRVGKSVGEVELSVDVAERQVRQTSKLHEGRWRGPELQARPKAAGQ